MLFLELNDVLHFLIIINKYCKLFNVYFSLCFFFENEDKYVFKAREFVLLLVQVDNSQWILYD